MRRAAITLPAPLPGLFYLTDPDRTPDPALTSQNLPKGAGIVYRHFGAADRSEKALELSNIAARRGLVFLIAADPELALQAGAHGVHWPEARRREARRWTSAFAVQTVSAHTPAALRRAEQIGFDAVLLSTVFPSTSPSAGKAMGAVRFRRLSGVANIPVYALGGVDARTGPEIASCGGLASIEGVETAFGETTRGEVKIATR